MGQLDLCSYHIRVLVKFDSNNHAYLLRTVKRRNG